MKFSHTGQGGSGKQTVLVQMHPNAEKAATRNISVPAYSSVKVVKGKFMSF